MKKNYVLDTNILMENEKSIEILKNGVENRILIPSTVFEELDGLKKNPTKRFQVARILLEIEKYKDYIEVIGDTYQHTPDNEILNIIQDYNDELFDEKPNVYIKNHQLYIEVESVCDILHLHESVESILYYLLNKNIELESDVFWEPDILFKKPRLVNVVF